MFLFYLYLGKCIICGCEPYFSIIVVLVSLILGLINIYYCLYQEKNTITDKSLYSHL